jgi:hypothetical protein
LANCRDWPSFDDVSPGVGDRSPHRSADLLCGGQHRTLLQNDVTRAAVRSHRTALPRHSAQIEEWLSEESSPIREVELIQQRLDIDAQLAQIDQAQRLAELEKAFVEVAASWTKRSGITAAALREVGVPASVLRRAGLL